MELNQEQQKLATEAKELASKAHDAAFAYLMSLGKFNPTPEEEAEFEKAGDAVTLLLSALTLLDPSRPTAMSDIQYHDELLAIAKRFRYR